MNTFFGLYLILSNIKIFCINKPNFCRNLFLITARILHVNFGGVYDINYMKGRDASTPQANFQSVDDILAKMVFNGIIVLRWDLITLTNIGNRNSIKTKALEKNPTIKILGCPCYVLHNVAMKASHCIYCRKLQSYEPLVYLLYRCQQRFMNKLASK